jgi:carboxypeptidase C (cathepsin A)
VYATALLNYFSNDTVKANLHVTAAPHTWDYCSEFINYTSGKNASYDIYVSLKGKYRILKYSGDTDGAIPTFGTQQWIKDLNWSVQEAWRPMMLNGQVAGYVEIHDGLTFVTIHGAGHMAPQWKRPQTYHAIFNFIKNQPL